MCLSVSVCALPARICTNQCTLHLSMKIFKISHTDIIFVLQLKPHILWCKPAHIAIRWFIRTHQTTCCIQVITSVLFFSQMRLDSTILYNLVSWQGGRRERGGESMWERESERERVCPFGPSFWPFSQSNECERECKGSQGPQRAKHCLNDVITMHLFPLHLFHLHILSHPLFIPHPLLLFFSLSMWQLTLNWLFNVMDMCVLILCV